MADLEKGPAQDRREEGAAKKNGFPISIFWIFQLKKFGIPILDLESFRTQKNRKVLSHKKISSRGNAATCDAAVKRVTVLL